MDQDLRSIKVNCCQVALALAALAFMQSCKPLGLHATRVTTPGMEPTIEKGEVVTWFELDDAGRAKLQSGSIVVFKAPDDPEKIRVKRIVAVEGNSLEIRDSTLYVNDEPVRSPYGHRPGARSAENIPRVEIPMGTVFVMGDNWDSSLDSRRFGPIPIDSIVGKLLRE